MHVLPPGVGEKEVEKLEQESPEFQIDELFEVSKELETESLRRFDNIREYKISISTYISNFKILLDFTNAHA